MKVGGFAALDQQIEGGVQLILTLIVAEFRRRSLSSTTAGITVDTPCRWRRLPFEGSEERTPAHLSGIPHGAAEQERCVGAVQDIIGHLSTLMCRDAPEGERILSVEKKGGQLSRPSDVAQFWHHFVGAVRQRRAREP